MRTFYHLIFTIFIFILISLSPTNAHSKEVKCFVLAPPEQMLNGIKQIAVMDFEASGDGENAGVLMSDYIVSGLLQKQRGIEDVEGGFWGLSSEEGKTYQKGVTTDIYTIAERSRIKQVIEEQQFSESGIVADEQATSIGQVLGVDAVITGSINTSIDDEEYEENRQDEYGNYYTVFCREAKVKITASMRIVNVETGQIIGQKSEEANLEYERCDDDVLLDLFAPQNPDEMPDQCMKLVAMSLLNYFSPYFALQEIKLKEVKTKDYKDKSKSALKDIENDELHPAFVKY